jgi:hypothetical protein
MKALQAFARDYVKYIVLKYYNCNPPSPFFAHPELKVWLLCLQEAHSSGPLFVEMNFYMRAARREMGKNDFSILPGNY